MARLKALRVTVLTSASQSTRAGLRTEVADRGAWTTSSLASDDGGDRHRHGGNFQAWTCGKSTAWEDGFSDGVGGLQVPRWTGCILHLATHDAVEYACNFYFLWSRTVPFSLPYSRIQSQ
jgi:hypothetical protein